MKRTPGSWLIGLTEHYEVVFGDKSKRNFTTTDRKEAEARFLEARKQPGAEVLGVFKHRTLVEKICVKGIPYEEQTP